MRSLGIARETLPMALEREWNALNDSNRGEKSPSAQKARLPGRQPYFLDGQQAVIVKNNAMNHFSSGRSSILAQQFLRVQSTFRRLLVLEVHKSLAVLREIRYGLSQFLSCFGRVVLFSKAQVGKTGSSHVGRFEFFAFGLAKRRIRRAEQIVHLIREPGSVTKLKCS